MALWDMCDIPEDLEVESSDRHLCEENGPITVQCFKCKNLGYIVFDDKKYKLSSSPNSFVKHVCNKKIEINLKDI